MVQTWSSRPMTCILEATMTALQTITSFMFLKLNRTPSRITKQRLLKPMACSILSFPTRSPLSIQIETTYGAKEITNYQKKLKIDKTPPKKSSTLHSCFPRLHLFQSFSVSFRFFFSLVQASPVVSKPPNLAFNLSMSRASHIRSAISSVFFFPKGFSQAPAVFFAISFFINEMCFLLNSAFRTVFA